jgi:hypothetical protein
MILAQALIVRALRRAGLHHILFGHPGVVGFVVPELDVETYVGAAWEVLERHRMIVADPNYQAIHWDGTKLQRGSQASDEADLLQIMSVNGRIFGFASDEGGIPPLFRAIANDIVSVGPVDLPALRGVFQIVLGRVPADSDLGAAIGIPMNMLSVAIKRGRNPGWALRRLKSLSAIDRKAEVLASLGRRTALDTIAATVGQSGRATADDIAGAIGSAPTLLDRLHCTTDINPFVTSSASSPR